MRALIGLAGTCSVLALPSLAAGEPLSPGSPLYSPSAPLTDENPYVTAEYSGTLKQESTADTIIEHDHRTAELKWNTKVAGPIDQIEYQAIYGASAIHWQVSELAGTVSNEEENKASKAKSSCKGTFSPTSQDGGGGGIELPLDQPGYQAGGGNPATNPDYRVAPPQGIPLSLLASSSTESRCEAQAWNSPEAWLGEALSQPGYEGSTGPVDYFPPGLPYTQSIDPPPYTSPVNPNQSFKVTLTSTLKFTSPALPKSGVSSGPVTGTSGKGPAPISCGAGSKPGCANKQAARLAAAKDLRAQLDPLTLQCGIAAVGTSLLVAGVIAPEFGAGAGLVVAGPAGAEVLLTSGPACAILIKRIYDDAKTIEDPPAGSFRKLARPSVPRGPAAKLPACTSAPASARRFCETLRAEELRYLAALRAGQAVAAAMLTTTDRISGAARAKAGSALRIQTRQANSLAAQLRSNDAAESSAGRAVASLIAGAKLTLGLSGAQTQAGITRGFAGLARLGVSGARVEQLAGVELTGTPTEGLGVLRG